MTKTPNVEISVVALEVGPNNEVHLPDEHSSLAEERKMVDRMRSQIRKILELYDFPIAIVFAIGLAKLYPPLGAKYLKPTITASWIAIALMFFCIGITLKSEELKKSIKRVKFNVFVQIFNFFVVSAVVFGVSRALVEIGTLMKVLADGMVICSCLPVAINAVVIIASAAKGDAAAAVFHAVFGNLVGIFLSPVLILAYLGKSGNVSLRTVFYQISLRVIVPVIVGQALRLFLQGAREFADQYKYFLSKTQQYLLVYTVYTIFCGTFSKGKSTTIGNVFLMILFQFLLMVFVKVLAWYSLKLFFRDQPRLRVTGMYACVQKTIALGVPIIQSIYEHNPNKGLYTLPILVWHPMQLVVGSLLTDRLGAIVTSKLERLEIKEENLQISTRTEVDESPIVEDFEVKVEAAKDPDHDLHLQENGTRDDKAQQPPPDSPNRPNPSSQLRISQNQ